VGGEIVDRILRLIGLKQLPQVGDIYWMEDCNRGILTSKDEHPNLVVRCPKNRHQPMVGLAPGSSTRIAVPGMVVLEADPADVDPAGGLSKPTRFFLHETSRFAVSKLGRRIGRLHGAKLMELKSLRALGI
jgi:mRNA-degrading endonuclease toxin of MazEF toxin-antitoxin module